MPQTPGKQLEENRRLPLYRQLAERIAVEIPSGALPPGSRLDTVRDLAEKLSVARGTIKRAYDELERQGLIEKVQGRGSFVCYQPENSDSRKERALSAIEQMLQQLQNLGFSTREAEIFFQLKLRERRQNKLRPRLGVTDSNPALLRQLTSSLHQALNSQSLQADICPYALDEILRSPYRISQEIDWLISTEEQAAQLELANLSPYQDKLLTVTLSLTAESLHIVEEKLHGALSRHEQAHTEEQEAAQ